MSSMVIVATEEQIEVVLARVLVKMGLAPASAPPAPAHHVVEHNEMPTLLVKKYLKEKGYNVSSCQALNKLMEEHKIGKKKRGKDNWYKVADLERIPSKV